VRLGFLIAIAVAACGHADPKPEPSTPAAPEVVRFDEAADRLVAMLDQGWVVSRDVAGAPAHEGDSLIWTGVAMGDLDCARGDQLEAALISMVEATDGKLFRHPTLKNKVSLDGAVGLYFGVAERVEHCPGAADRWHAVLAAHPRFFDDPLNDQEQVRLPLGFKAVRALLGARLGLVAPPTDGELRELEREVAGWVRAVKAGKKAFDLHLIDEAPSCFRVHVAHRTLEAVEALGAVVTREGRDDFCQATDGLAIGTVDQWCGRPVDLGAWVQGFQYDRWEFAFQRCQAWEAPDGNGLHTPALDLIDALRKTYAVKRAFGF
jgi:hypothetical protein